MFFGKFFLFCFNTMTLCLSKAALIEFVERNWDATKQLIMMQKFIEKKMMTSPLNDKLFESKSSTALYTETP